MVGYGKKLEVACVVLVNLLRVRSGISYLMGQRTCNTIKAHKFTL